MNQEVEGISLLYFHSRSEYASALQLMLLYATAKCMIDTGFTLDKTDTALLRTQSQQRHETIGLWRHRHSLNGQLLCARPRASGPRRTQRRPVVMRRVTRSMVIVEVRIISGNQDALESWHQARRPGARRGKLRLATVGPRARQEI